MELGQSKNMICWTPEACSKKVTKTGTRALRQMDTKIYLNNAKLMAMFRFERINSNYEHVYQGRGMTNGHFGCVCVYIYIV